MLVNADMQTKGLSQMVNKYLKTEVIWKIIYITILGLYNTKRENNHAVSYNSQIYSENKVAI